MTITGNSVNLCDSCRRTYPDCDVRGDGVVFGDGIGGDNICACCLYDPMVKRGPDDYGWEECWKAWAEERNGVEKSG